MTTHSNLRRALVVRSRYLAPFAILGSIVSAGCADLDDNAAVASERDDLTADVPANADGAAGSTAQFTPAGIFRNVGNNLCLQPAGESMADVPIVQAVCNKTSSAQAWTPQPVSGNDYIFRNLLTSKCMYLDVNQPVNGAPIVQAPCDGVTNELWRSSAHLPEVVAVTTRVGGRVTNFCIDVPGGSSQPGLAIELFACNGSLAQRWTVGFAP